MKKAKTENGFQPKPKRKLDRHAKKDSTNKSSKVYSKPYKKQGR